jgi:hypothetical protein
MEGNKGNNSQYNNSAINRIKEIEEMRMGIST